MEVDMPRLVIPEKYQEFCLNVARLCKQYGLQSFSGEFRPDIHDMGQWRDNISISWSAGRHNADVNEVNISGHVFVHATLEEVKG